MTTITLELPDDVYNAFRIEAHKFGTSPEQLLKQMVEQTHHLPSKDERLSPEQITARRHVRAAFAASRTERANAHPHPAFFDDSREAIYFDDRQTYSRESPFYDRTERSEHKEA